MNDPLLVGVVHRGMQEASPFNAFYLLALAGVLNSVVSLYYYARIVKAMYLEDAPKGSPAIVLVPEYMFLMGLLVVPTVALGLFWERTLAWMMYAGRTLFADREF